MNKADVIRMADECQLFDGIWSHPELKELKADKFIKFANLAAAIEREAIIGLLKGIDQTECESKDGYWETSFGAAFGKELLSTIRARGQE